MQQCLSHPTRGYYMNPENSVFGAEGDFITSPEITQMFGELIAVWLISQYHALGKELPLRIVELGPGKGTLMGDILRVVLQFIPKRTINVHLVETSLSMRATQKAHLESANHPNVHLHWHNSINDLSSSSTEYTMLVAHEFFDALPIHILKKAENNTWHEVLVASTAEEKPQTESDSAESNATSQPAASTSESTSSFRYVLAPQPTPISTVLGLSSPRFNELPTGSTLEVSPTSFRIARKVGELLATGSAEEELSIGGAGLIIDYGANHAFDNSLRAFQNHKIVDPFHAPGTADLTANVDFAYLSEAMADLVATHGPLDQRDFLHGMGLPIRLQGLMQRAATQAERERLWGAAFRLVDKEGMGGQYRVLGVTGRRAAEGESGVEGGGPVWPFVSHPDVEARTE
ncbi:DUF185-domain-containing protein [Pholiota conissans]|uniref:Protein arginine methyltransferase NDUFAF7 n=1 Tax=Pholiota conissans TaxID=109636 RepID=A0A9P5Z0F4_9AGAR|nr:DUF185-domain-containing protein [Pholiota conissans]